MEYDFDKALHRKIRSGSEFDNLIPKSQNTNINFETSSKQILESDTFDTLIFIDQWVTKYHNQLAKVAPLLKGNNTAQTAANIYHWLYNHFQYQLDKSPLKQRLLSPAAAWKHRTSGIDCKSFSLLASCLLTELKVPHSLRMVKQKGIKSFTNPNEWIVNPNYWSHVYVAIPEGTKFHIIDATTHDNREVQIVEKYDHKMIHQGLNGAYAQNSLGCACQGTSLAQNGLGNPATMGFAITNFHTYLTDLERQGVSRTVTDKMLFLVKANVEMGIDPDMNDIFQKAFSNSQLGAGFSGLITDIKGTANTEIRNLNSGLSNISVGGVKFSDVAGAISGDNDALLNVAKDKIKGLMPSNFISSTFGAVFANGFNLSCWGASLTPQKAQDNISKFHNPHFNYLLNKISTATTLQGQQDAINRFIKDVYTLDKYYEVYKPKAADWSSCAQKAIKDGYLAYMRKLKIQANSFISEITSQGATLTQERLSPLKFFFTPETTGNQQEETKNNPSDSFVDYPQVNMSSVKNPNLPSTGTGTNVGGIKGGSIPVKGGTIKNPATTNKSEGVSPVLLLTGVGIALKLLI